MKFNLEISTDSRDEKIKDRCMEAVAEILEKEGGYFSVGYEVTNGKKRIVKEEGML